MKASYKPHAFDGKWAENLPKEIMPKLVRERLENGETSWSLQVLEPETVTRKIDDYNYISETHYWCKEHGGVWSVF